MEKTDKVAKNIASTRAFFHSHAQFFQKELEEALPNSPFQQLACEKVYDFVRKVLGFDGASMREGRIKEHILKIIGSFQKVNGSKACDSQLMKELLLEIVSKQERINISYQEEKKGEAGKPLTPLTTEQEEQQKQDDKSIGTSKGEEQNKPSADPLQKKQQSEQYKQEEGRVKNEESQHQPIVHYEQQTNPSHIPSHTPSISDPTLSSMLGDTIRQYKQLLPSIVSSGEHSIWSGVIADLEKRERQLKSVKNNDEGINAIEEAIKGRLDYAFHQICKLKIIISEKQSFEEIDKKLNHMNIGRFMFFCTSFNLLSKQNKARAMTLFKRHSVDHLADFPSFINIFKDLSKDKTGSKDSGQSFIQFMQHSFGTQDMFEEQLKKLGIPLESVSPVRPRAINPRRAYASDRFVHRMPKLRPERVSRQTDHKDAQKEAKMIRVGMNQSERTSINETRNKAKVSGKKGVREESWLLEGEEDELLDRLVGRNSSVVVQKINRRAQEYRLSQDRTKK